MATNASARGRGKNKQYWRDDEIEALVDTLAELASDPLWKVDGGFKNNYMVEVHKMMLRKIPNFDKEADPHIDSKIKWLKSKYNLISEMCRESGCQWDHVEHKINCERQWYDEWCLKHKNASGLWNFRFPYLHKLDLVWGKYRATGEKAEDITEASVDVNFQKYTSVYSSESEEEIAIFPKAQASPASSSNTNVSKKRKKLSPRRESFYKKKKARTLQQTIDLKLDNFTTKFESVCDQMASQYAVVTNALITEPKSESLSEEKMQDVIKELILLGISSMDIGRAVEICYRDPAKVQVMFALPSNLRKSFVLGFIYPSPANP